MSVLDSAAFIAQNSRHVSIPEENLDAAAQTILADMKRLQYSTHTWNEHPMQPKTHDRATVDWIFLVDLLNFSFWSDRDEDDCCTPHPERYTVSFEGTRYTSYWSLCAAVNRALAEGVPITNPAFYRDAPAEVLAHVFRSDTVETIPLLEDRIRVMHEAGRILCEEFDGSFANCIARADRSALKMLDLLVKYFPSFRDIHEFEGRKVFILKRAQILIADTWACFDGQSFGEFRDIDAITMFADYRVPQALYHLGVLRYSPALMEKLERREPLLSGSREEVEIRGNSIWAVELLMQRIRQIKADKDIINAILIDFYIWDSAKRMQDQMVVPIHRTRSIYY